jgi:hypothetical protein
MAKLDGNLSRLVLGTTTKNGDSKLKLLKVLKWRINPSNMQPMKI